MISPGTIHAPCPLVRTGIDPGHPCDGFEVEVEFKSPTRDVVERDGAIYAVVEVVAPSTAILNQKIREHIQQDHPSLQLGDDDDLPVQVTLDPDVEGNL